ncbi:MAG: hypothetical protein VW500_04120, partial [Aquiluna sp.]
MASEDSFEIEKSRFLDSLERMDSEVPIPNRLQDRRNQDPQIPLEKFANTPDTDPSVAAIRQWAKRIYKRLEN